MAGFGFIACVLAGVLFGSNFVPAKKYEVGDGIFFQWIMAMGILCVGFVSLGFSNSREILLFPMIGGVLWCTSNVLCLQVIKLIGLSMGFMVWGIINSLLSWATGKFGLFDLPVSKVSNEGMNYAGVSLTLISLALFAHVQTDIKKREKSVIDPMAEPMMGIRENDVIDTTSKGPNWLDTIPKPLQRIIGIIGAVIAGVLIGTNSVPPLYTKANQNGPQGNIDYVFSHYSGIFLTATLFMVLNAIYQKNEPFSKSDLILPGLASGTMWGLAQIFYFIAIEEVDLAIAAPIVASIPCIVAGLWGLVYFKEVTGLMNIIFFVSGTFVSLIGVILVAVSSN